MKSLLRRLRGQGKGQSFVELAFVFLVLLIMFAGLTEFGNSLNQYIGLIDGAREGARAAANADPFLTIGMDDYNADFYTAIDNLVEGIFLPDGTMKLRPAIDPLRLTPTNGLDDVVISVFGVTYDGDIERFPKTPNADSRVTVQGWSAHGNRQSKFNNTQIGTLLSNFITTYGNAPNTGIVVVEVFYHYTQILNMLPYPIELHAYSIMPLTAAEPTPTPP